MPKIAMHEQPPAACLFVEFVEVVVVVVADPSLRYVVTETCCETCSARGIRY
jgi:hypothetical protein|eukprot:COSAG06_NODE_2879_length_6140_cov_22.302930_6_plen_52_part_00